MSISGGDGANNQNYPDAIRPLDGAQSFITYSNGYTAGIYYHGDYTVVYLAFGIEGLSSATYRAEVLGRALSLSGQ